MLDVREHRRVLLGIRETRGRALGSHRQEIGAARAAWRRAREARPAVHRAVLEGERREMQHLARLHRATLAQSRWILAIADRLQGRFGSSR